MTKIPKIVVSCLALSSTLSGPVAMVVGMPESEKTNSLHGFSHIVIVVSLQVALH